MSGGSWWDYEFESPLLQGRVINEPAPPACRIHSCPGLRSAVFARVYKFDVAKLTDPA